MPVENRERSEDANVLPVNIKLELKLPELLRVLAVFNSNPMLNNEKLEFPLLGILLPVMSDSFVLAGMMIALVLKEGYCYYKKRPLSRCLH